MKNYFMGMRSIIIEALIQRGSTTWTIDRQDLPTNESMEIFCDSLLEGKRVKWEAKNGSLLSLSMVIVTFNIEAWEKPARRLMLALRQQNQPPKT